MEKTLHYSDAKSSNFEWTYDWMNDEKLGLILDEVFETVYVILFSNPSNSFSQLERFLNQ